MSQVDAIVVGAGPNGLAAAITLAQAGCKVILFEAGATVGGGMRSAELTEPGFRHDICSAIHPLGVGSPFFRALPLQQYGLQWITPPLPLAHPLDGGRAVSLQQSLTATAAQLGRDGDRYQRLIGPLLTDWQALIDGTLAPLLRLPAAPLALAQFGVRGLLPAELLAKRLFHGEAARALFAGLAAHAIMPLEWPLTAAFGLVLGVLGHAVGWPLPRGGSQSIADALAAHLTALGGEIVCEHEVTSLADLPPAKCVLLDVTPKQLLQIGAARLPAGYARRLRSYRYGPGVFKIDYALSEPVPWQAPICREAGTVHLGATLSEIARSERQVWQGAHPEKPYVLIAQQSVFDDSRAPKGKQTLWAYCHVPAYSTVDMTAAIERQITRFAPGFQDVIIKRHTMTTAAYQRYNSNYIGGDINGGVQNWRQLATRPVIARDPYRTPLGNVYLCSSSTPPGGGVHGMCGYHAAQSALRHSL